MFSYLYDDNTRGAVISVRRGRRTRDFAMILFEGFHKEFFDTRARAYAFCATLCRMLNEPDKIINRYPDTRYNFEMKIHSHPLRLPIFSNPRGRRIAPDKRDGVRTTVERYDGEVMYAPFATIDAWVCDIARLHTAVEKTIHCMEELDPLTTRPTKSAPRRTAQSGPRNG